jgi:hypothetical protein
MYAPTLGTAYEADTSTGPCDESCSNAADASCFMASSATSSSSFAFGELAEGEA